MYAPLCIPVNRSFSTVISYIGPNSSKIGRRSFSSRLRGICPTKSLTASASFIGTPTRCAWGGGWCRCVTGPFNVTGPFSGCVVPPDSTSDSIGPFVNVVMFVCSADEPRAHTHSHDKLETARSRRRRIVKRSGRMKPGASTSYLHKSVVSSTSRRRFLGFRGIADIRRATRNTEWAWLIDTS